MNKEQWRERLQRYDDPLYIIELMKARLLNYHDQLLEVAIERLEELYDNKETDKEPKNWDEARDLITQAIKVLLQEGSTIKDINDMVEHDTWEITEEEEE